MRIHRMNVRRGFRAAALTVALGIFAGTAGCGDWLAVTNPGAIVSEDLEDVTHLQLMFDGVVGDFQPSVAWTALFSGAFADELRMHHAFFENLQMDQRRVEPNNGTYALAVFNGLHRARFMADSVASRYRTLLGDTVSRDLRYAKTIAYAGYTYTLLGENICETRIDAAGAPLQPDELFTRAVTRFDAAIAAAAVARSNAANIASVAARDRLIAGSDSVANLARVGAARASLNRGDAAAAIAYASAVTPAYDAADAFRYDTHYIQGNSSAETRRTGNPFWEFISAGGSWVSISGTGYDELGDPRIPHGTDPVGTADGTQRWVPRSPRSFSTHDGSPEGALFVSTSSMRLASAMEARYILAEAQGNTAPNVLFLNAQRAIGNQPALVAPTDAQYMAALREQRAREFFIDGHRLGDLRRYEAVYSVDLWPTGPMYGGTTTYGDQKCWPTPISELF
jgi:starch-binding outer membrane protein, SusD/RagB family